MKRIQIIPAIDLIDGKCVRLSQGDYSQKIIYNADPVDQAMLFADSGLKFLHLVDLDGAKAGRLMNLKVLERIASRCQLTIDFGGGIKSHESLQDVFNAGADIATVGSIAVKQPELLFEWIRLYGPDKLFLGADVKNECLAVSGWLEQTEVSIFPFLENYQRAGLQRVFCTDIEQDGLLKGPSVDLYKKILEKIPGLQLVASGGVSQVSDIERLEKIGCTGVIVGKAFYEGKIAMNDLKDYL